MCVLTILDHCCHIFGDKWRSWDHVSLGPWLQTSSTRSYGSYFEPSRKSLMVIFLCVLALFFLFFFEVPYSSVSMLVEGPVTSSLTHAFLVFAFSTSITSPSSTFSFPLDSKWITFIDLSPASLGNGRIVAATYGGRLKICRYSIGAGGGWIGAWGLSLGRVTCLLGPLP